MTYDPFLEIKRQHQGYYDPNECEVYVIGDVHGCGKIYRELVTACEFDAYTKDKYCVIAQLGDMIDRGPDFIDLIMNDPADIKVMGNHEYNFILEHFQYKRCTSKSRHTNHNIFEETPRDVKNFVIQKLLDRKKFFVCQYGQEKFVFSHAPIKDIEKGMKALEHKIWHNMNLSDFCMRSTKVGELTGSDSITYIHGHQSWDYTDIEEQINEQRNRKNHIFNVDSRCVYGNELVALRLSDLGVLRVKSNISVEHSN